MAAISGAGPTTAPESVRGVAETLPRCRDPRAVRRAHRWRAVALTGLAVVVLLGASGLLGVHTSSTQRSAQGYTVRVDYPRVARAGLDVPWHVEVTKPGGFPGGTVTLAVSRSWFDIMETQGFHPEPDASTGDDEWVYLDFAAPPGDVLTVDYDAYIQPSSQLGRRGTVAVISDGERRVEASWRTVLLP